MPLQNFVDNSIPTIKAAWLNSVDVFYTTLFNSATTAAQAMTALGMTAVGQAIVTAANAATARTTLGAAAAGANSDITSLNGLTAPTVASNPVRASDLQKQTVIYIGTTGTSTAYTASATPVLTVYADGTTLDLQFHLNCGASPTLNINGLGAVSLFRELTDGTLVALAANEIVQFHPVKVSYYSNGPYFLVRDLYARKRTKFLSATRDMTAANGSVAYTGCGFKPSKITAYAGVVSVLPSCIGVVTATGTQCQIVGTSSGSNSPDATHLIYNYSTTAGAAQSAVLSSLDSDGFTLTWTKVNTPAAGTCLIQFFCEE